MEMRKLFEFEILEDETKKLIHLRSGQEISAFIVTGETLDGRARTLRFAADKAAFNAMQQVQVEKPTYLMKFTNGDELALNMQEKS